ncbi:exo-alpha-sialidase [Streptomyces rectiverticillatus]|uniref:glycoside hydrolase n=1 Tax=Streptomyces rectiverticillatus TaxID=173860 RepID=UPI0015C34984|nr:glycoside hydrolase [Streptomyces rectiverticillatus]QLE75201.1 exo-alpha-sialidase [Streptomyces rectiverticillatus]
MGRAFRSVTRAAVALAVACAGALVAAPAAPAAQTAPAVSGGCSMDLGAQGDATGASGSPVSVPRADGRVDQFQVFYDSSATQGLPFVWHRAQSAPGGSYGAWERVSAGTVGPKASFVTAVENAAGGLEVFWLDHGGFCHSVQGPAGGQWSTPENFGLRPSPYHGFLTLFKRSNGTLIAMASSSGKPDRSMESRTQLSSDGVWRPAEAMGKVPATDAGLGQPSTVTELPDRRLKVTAREWNRDRYWQITEAAPNDGIPSGWWPSQWQLCATPRCD